LTTTLARISLVLSSPARRHPGAAHRARLVTHQRTTSVYVRMSAPWAVASEGVEHAQASGIDTPLIERDAAQKIADEARFDTRHLLAGKPARGGMPFFSGV